MPGQGYAFAAKGRVRELDTVDGPRGEAASRIVLDLHSESVNLKDLKRMMYDNHIVTVTVVSVGEE